VSGLAVNVPFDQSPNRPKQKQNEPRLAAQFFFHGINALLGHYRFFV
jgi:hypothetical protein